MTTGLTITLYFTHLTFRCTGLDHLLSLFRFHLYDKESKTFDYVLKDVDPEFLRFNAESKIADVAVLVTFYALKNMDDDAEEKLQFAVSLFNAEDKAESNNYMESCLEYLQTLEVINYTCVSYGKCV